MVLDDITRPIPQSDAIAKTDEKDFTSRLASPLDRLAANVADFVVFFPLLALVIAPFSRQAKEAQILGRDDLWMLSVSGATICGVLALIVYQTVFITWFGATPGKLAFRLRVVSIWTEKRPKPFDAFLRSLVWVLGGLMAGVPFLAVYSNERRRPFHDRVADSVVIALTKDRRVKLAGLAEVSLASGFQSAVLAVFVLFCSLHISDLRQKRASVAEEAQREEDLGKLCPEIREGVDESDDESNSHRARLLVALNLFESEQLEPDCLDSEADFALWNDKEQSLAYLAKGLADNDLERADKYFSKACASEDQKEPVGRDVCRMVALVRSEGSELTDRELASEREAELSSVLGRVDASSSTFLKISVLHHYMQERDFRSGLKLISSLDQTKNLGPYIAKTRAQALWGLGRHHEAQAAMLATSDLVERKERVDLARWFCSNELFSGGCSGANSCDLLKHEIQHSDSWLLRPEVAATYLHAVSCEEDRETGSWSELAAKMPLREGKAYAEALTAEVDGERSTAVSKLRALAESTAGSHGAFFLEASARLAELARSRKELAPILQSWQKMDPSEENWKPLGQSLVRRMNSLGIFDSALSVGLRITKHDPYDRQIFEQMVVAARGAGNDKLAGGLLETVVRLKGSDLSSRAPASLEPVAAADGGESGGGPSESEDGSGGGSALGGGASSGGGAAASGGGSAASGGGQ